MIRNYSPLELKVKNDQYRDKYYSSKSRKGSINKL